MARVKIKVLGAYPAWDDRARSGRLERADGSVQPVLLHPGVSGSLEGMERARVEGRAVAAIRHARVLHLKQVMAVAGAPVAVFDGFEGASLARILAVLESQGRALPLRVVFEIAAGVAEGVAAAWTGSDASRRVLHPGVTPAHVLISVSGGLKLVGFRAPDPGTLVPGPPGYRAPEGRPGAPALVYAVGALLVQLLGGEDPPGAASRHDRHAATLRRAMIRVLSRKGPRPPEPAVTLVQACLSWEPDSRPKLASLSDRLAEAARQMPEPGLSDWAGAELAQLWPTLHGGPSPEAGPETPRRRDLPMAVGPLPDGMRLDQAPTEEADRTELQGVGVPRGAGRRETVQVGAGRPVRPARRGPTLAADAPTAEDTEEVERTQEVTDGSGVAAEVTVSTPRPEQPAPVFDRTLMSTRPVQPAPGIGTPRHDADGPVVMGIAPAQNLGGRSGAGPSFDLGPAQDAGGPDSQPGPVSDVDWRPPRSRRPLVLAVIVVVALLAGTGWWVAQQRAMSDVAAVEGPIVEASTSRIEVHPVQPVEGDVAAQGQAGEQALEEGEGGEQGEGEVPAADPVPEVAAAPTPDPAPDPASDPASAAAPTAAPASTPKASPPPASTARGSSSGSGGSGSSTTTEDVDAASAYIRPASTTPASTTPASTATTPASTTPASTATTPASTSSVLDAVDPYSTLPTEAPPAPPVEVEVEIEVPAGPPYSLVFKAGDAAVETMDVACHGSRSGSGREIRIPDAIAGPCRVMGTVGGEKLVAHVAVSKSGTWTCFEGGQRACR